MDWFRGLRAATAVSVPVLLGGLLHMPILAWAALGGFEAILADPGGPYRHRIRSIAVLSVGGAIGCFIGAFAGGHMEYALAVTLAWCFVWSYLLVLGSPFASAGPLVQVIYFCGLGAPSPHYSVAAAQAGYVLVGGLWAMLLSLFLWPVDPYRPARFAVSECFRELASFLTSIQELNLRSRTRPALWHRLARHHQGRVRRALETARESIASVRAQRTSESIRTNHLIVLLESADLLVAHTVALAEFLENSSSDTVTPCVARAKSSLLLISQAESWIADLLRRRFQQFEETARNYQMRLLRVPNDMTQCLAPDDADGQFLLHQMAEITQNIEVALDSVVAVRTARETRRGKKQAKLPAPVAVPLTWMETLRANWNPESLMLRHAIRVTAVCGLDVWILYHFHISHGYWLPLTSLIVLQPHLAGTFRRSLQRMGGTIAGGILAAVLAVFLHTQLTMAAALFPLALLTLAVYPVSYTWFCFFLTPTFVLVSLPYFGDWQLAAIRIGNTVLGAVLALLAMSLLWPAWERDRFGLQLQRSLEANRRYIDALIAAWKLPGAITPGAQQNLALARRGIGLAHNDSEDSLDRLVLEPALPGTASRRAASHAMEPAIAFVAYLRRFAQSITTLAATPADDAWKRSPQVQQRLAVMRIGLASLSARLKDPLANDSVSLADPSQSKVMAALDPRHPGERQLMRMERQLTVLDRNLLAMQSAHLFPVNARQQLAGQEVGVR
jgi:uncharacterized membrane protein YccC